MGKVGLMSAIWLGKAYTTFARSLRLGGGSSFPGVLARRIEPNALRLLSGQVKRGTVMITGTNGKTTTATLLGEILKSEGLTLVHNHSGANLIAGLTTAFIDEANLWANVNRDLAIMEVDEATIPKACSEIKPKIVVVTNFFRDQLDRYGELDKTVSFIRRGLQVLPPGTTVVLNGDDPLVAGLGDIPGLKFVYFGIEDRSIGLHQMNQTSDAKYCSRCGTPFGYELYYYAHLGRFHCPKCGFTRPQLDISLESLRLHGMQGSVMQVRTPQGSVEFAFKLPGLYNVYNALAAVAVANQLGVGLDRIRTAVPEFKSAFGRMEAVPVNGRLVHLALVKNPVGYNEVLRTFLSETENKQFLFILNDNYADGTDISWIWDVDFEPIGDKKEQIRFIITSGQRAEDMAVRLKYAGIDAQQLTVVNDITQAFDQAVAQVPEGGQLFVLPTYTAMLTLREMFSRRGYTRQFWEGKKK